MTTDTTPAPGPDAAPGAAPDKASLPHADASADPEGRLTLEVPLPGEPAEPALLLVLRPKKGEPETVTHRLPLAPAPGRPGRWRTELAPDTPALEEGRWDVFALPAGEERLRLLPGLRDLRALSPGYAATAAAPLAVRLPYATKDRYLAVRAWRRRVHAEAGDLTLEGGTMTVEARLIGAEPGEGAEALLKLRGGGKDGPVLRAPLAVEPGGSGTFAFSFGLSALPPEPGFWDVHVRPAAGGPRVRVGRLLDDVADKKPLFVYPAVPAGEATARPYYTVDNDLSVEVR
ncbi:hypothetical protein RM780_15370 [Streptomyces sp. DSM 44917]|uniref:Transferase n=1 Tax=Streptomyces boetiae TaxID=3075541 RepID=A0ABU2LAG3_9ACTN|nr:hypothetical protein [Streptomyces sp. DSM 44917]MDT0308332.1 hypothetical protein [Streptomyces sp. DSM 44917]